MKKIIKGATKEHPYVQADYPYGFQLRCQRRLWVEERKGYGMRLVSQTSNPKKSILTWNAPKAGTYSPIACWVVDEEAKETESHGLSLYDRGEKAQKFLDEVWNLPAIEVSAEGARSVEGYIERADDWQTKLINKLASMPS